MADLTIAGNTYLDVPAVDFVKSGGGNARYYEPSEILYAGSATSGGVALATQAIPFGIVDSTSTSTAFTATVNGISELKDGTCVLLKNGVVTSASGFTIDINSLGAKPVYSNMASATAETTMFNVNYTMLFIYDSTRVSGGCWILYRGYNSNDNTIGYQLRSNSSTLPASDKFYRYRLLFTSADGTKFVPANTSTSTNATATRNPNTRPIDPFGKIVYYGSKDAVNANSNPSATVLWEQYAFSLGYSFNTTGAALTLTYPAPVYLKCTPLSNGSVTMDGYVQALPTTADNKVYIFLGLAYSETNIELMVDHPVYYYSNNSLRIWTNANGTTVEPASSNPLMDGTATVGTSVKYAREDHVHPVDTSRASATSLLNLSNAFKAFTITLNLNSWSSNTQIITNSNFLATGYAYIVCSSVSNLSEYNSCAIYADNITVDGQMVFYCDSVPESDLTVDIVRILAS